MILKLPIQPAETGRDYTSYMNPRNWCTPDDHLATPWMRTSDWYRGVFRRGRISMKHFRNGIWQPVLEGEEIKIYLTCIKRGCRTIHAFDKFAPSGYEKAWVQSDGYHTGYCVECDRCEYHFWCIFQGWEKLLELPIKEI